MAEDVQIKVVLTAEDKATPKLQGLKGTVQDLGGTFMRYLGPAALATTVIAGLKYCISEAMESEMVFARLKNVLQINGYAWEKVGDSVRNFASKLQNMTTYTDEEVAGVMQNLVILTGSLSKAMTGSKLALDMASSGMFGLDQATRLVGMAMSGNVSMLGRYIPELKDANLQKLGLTTNSEKATYAIEILTEKFKGLAEAELETTAGKIKNIKNAIGEMGEAIGAPIINALNWLIERQKELAKTREENYLAGNEEVADALAAKLEADRLAVESESAKLLKIRQLEEDAAKKKAELDRKKKEAEEQWRAYAKEGAMATLQSIREGNIAALRSFLQRVIDEVAATAIAQESMALMQSWWNPAAWGAIGMITAKWAAATAALTALMPQYEKGGIVQETGPALVHKGELITPAGETANTIVYVSCPFSARQAAKVMDDEFVRLNRLGRSAALA